MVTRIGGLASGMDIDSLVEQMMNAERIPLNKINQKKTYTEWQRDDYRTINSALLELDQLIFNGIGKQASYIKKTVNTSDANAVSIKNINSTVDFSGSLKVNKLATSATMFSTEKTGITDSSAKLNITAEQTIKISAINKDGVLQSEPYELKITADDTLDSIIAKINKDSGVSAFYDAQSQKIAFTAKNSGEIDGGQEIILSDDGATGESFFTNILKVSANNEIASAASSGSRGTNAELTYNGMDIERSSNTFQINGVEFTAKQVTATPVTFSSTADLEGVMGTIKKFVEKYNEIIDKIKTETSETKYRDYVPLTSEQKKEMNEDEIKLWEEKAKSGTLRNDSILTGLLTKMRNNIISPVSSLTGYTQLSQIGITTTSNYLDGGKLTIDEDKLSAAISENPNAVYELFQNSSTPSSGKGIAQQLRDTLKNAMTDITKKAGKASSVNSSYTLGKLLDNYSTQITKFEDRLTKIETRYWNQFTAMEKAISKANSQSAYISQQFAY